MISLNNLNYHKKINDYINKIFDITPKEMMECFGELIFYHMNHYIDLTIE